MQQVAGHHILLDPFDQRCQHLHAATAPVDQSAFGDISPHPGEDLVLAIQEKVIVEFGDEDVGEQVHPCHAARDRAAGRRHLHHALAAVAGFLGPGDLHDLQPRRDQIQHLADILAHQAQIAAAIRAATAGIQFLPLARCTVRDPGVAAGWRISRTIGG